MKWQTEQALQYMDKHNAEGLTVDELFESGLFGRRGDVASWLSRWKRKGYIRTVRLKGSYSDDQDWRSGPKTKYFTITDGSVKDWSTMMGQSRYQIANMRSEMGQSDDD